MYVICLTNFDKDLIHTKLKIFQGDLFINSFKKKTSLVRSQRRSRRVSLFQDVKMGVKMYSLMLHFGKQIQIEDSKVQKQNKSNLYFDQHEPHS